MKQAAVTTTPPLTLEPAHAEALAALLKALANPLRLRIVEVLCGGATHVTRLAEVLEVGQAVVSQQLRILRMCGLVKATRTNGFAVYRIAGPFLPELLACVRQCGAGADGVGDGSGR
ncbi:MAG: helix-turn-helix transcriptional regulator [Deltaproteobacteria bacterium]|nr:helix-turn-helix transcriptional regulator [Deltaproteobacteria bacterium]